MTQEQTKDQPSMQTLTSQQHYQQAAEHHEETVKHHKEASKKYVHNEQPTK